MASTKDSISTSFDIASLADFKAAMSIDRTSALAAHDRFDLNNRIFAFLIAFCAPLFGSAASVLVWVSLVWAFISFVLNRFPRVWSRDEWLMGLCFAGFSVVHIVSTLFHTGLSAYDEIVPALIFLAPLFLAALLALSDHNRLLDLFIIGAAAGAILGCIAGIIDTFFFSARAAGMLGNPGILALIGCAAAGIGGLNLQSKNTGRRLLGLASLIVILPIVITTQMRALWPAALCIIVIVGIAGWPTSLSKRRSVYVGCASAAVMTLIIITGWPMIEGRIQSAQHNFDQILTKGNYNNSIGQRLVMWESSLEAISQKPLTGYGMGERMEVVRGISLRDHPKVKLNYSHAHNAVLTALLDAGIAGFISLLIIWLAPLALAIRRRNRLVGTYFAVLAVAYGVSGLTGIMYHHDLTDAFYVFAIAVGMAKLGRSSSHPIQSGDLKQ